MPSRVPADVLGPLPSRVLAPHSLLAKNPKALNTFWDLLGHTETLR